MNLFFSGISAIFILFSCDLMASTAQKFTKAEIDLLVSQLTDAKWSKDHLLTIFNNDKVKRMPNMVTLNVTKPVLLKESVYAHFAEPAAIARVVDFKTQWQPYLTRAAKRFQVDEETILGILLGNSP